MCINPNLCIPTGVSSEGKLRVKVFRSVRELNHENFRSDCFRDSSFTRRTRDNLLSSLSSSTIAFLKEHGLSYEKAFLTPCGQCKDCRLVNANMWALRCVNEASLYPANCFVTLTYSDEHLYYLNDSSVRPSLCRKHIQDFFKRFRSHLDYHYGQKIRYLYAGEYGDRSGRPHYHFICFNYFPREPHLLKNLSTVDYKLFTDPLLSDLWPFGYNTVGSVTFESARYVAQYALKKQTGLKKSYYDEQGIIPEFVGSSTNPGLGFDFFNNNYESIVSNGFMVAEGHRQSIPRYYLKKLESINPYMVQYLRERRIKTASSLVHDFDRDFAREEIIEHRVSKFQHSLDNYLESKKFQ